jgi:hypothetical protein
LRGAPIASAAMSDPLSEAVRRQNELDASRASGARLLGQVAHDPVFDDMARRFARAMAGAPSNAYGTTKVSYSSSWEKKGLFSKAVEKKNRHVETNVVCRGWTVVSSATFQRNTHYEDRDALVVDSQGMKGDEIFIAEDGTWNRGRHSPGSEMPTYVGPVVYQKSPYSSLQHQDVVYGLREQIVEMSRWLPTGSNEGNWYEIKAAREELVPQFHEQVAAILADLASKAGRQLV